MIQDLVLYALGTSVLYMLQLCLEEILLMSFRLIFLGYAIVKLTV